MARQTTKTAQEHPAISKQINVTDLTTSQRRELFVYSLIQAGFTGFVKKVDGDQTYYTFIYKE